MTGTWDDALAAMRRALHILDETHAPGDIGAHLDLAIARLVEAKEATRDNANVSERSASKH